MKKTGNTYKVGLSLVPIFDILAAWGEEHRSELPEKV